MTLLFVDETLPYAGTSLDKVLQCLCCEKACYSDLECF